MDLSIDGLVKELNSKTVPTNTNLAGTILLKYGNNSGKFLIEGGKLSPLDGGDEVDTKLEFSAKQFEEFFITKEELLSVAYMRGDFKPEGATKSLMAFIEIVER